MEPVDFATFPRRAHHGSQQNATGIISVSISCLSNTQRQSCPTACSVTTSHFAFPHPQTAMPHARIRADGRSAFRDDGPRWEGIVRAGLANKTEPEANFI